MAKDFGARAEKWSQKRELEASHTYLLTEAQAFLVSGLERTGHGNQGGVTVTYTDTPGHNGGL